MTSLTTIEPASRWHSGEVTLQRSVGVADRMAIVGPKVIRDHMPDQHRDFYAQLPFIVAGAVDAHGHVWATLLAGAPGFATSPDPRTLALAVARDAGDPAAAGMNDGDAIGLLGIELHSRRRNRMNGTVRRSGDSGFAVIVEHSFGNCPQYIQLRDWQVVDADVAAPAAADRKDHLDVAARAMIAAADTFFVASYVDDDAGHRQVDASHRGGKAGFVRIDADGALTIPDFAGNLHFNTLGNFLLNPRAGLTFVDFASGDMLQMIGDAEVILDSPEIAAFQGAERLWRFRPRLVVRRPAALPLRWRFRDWSANSLMTGSWEDAGARLQAQALATQWRPFRVARIVDESAVIRSFHLEPADGAGMTPHRAGQHLPIRLSIAGQAKPVLRTYTLSTAPSDPGYRISVRRQGLASAHLHDHVGIGDIIEVRAPAGEFTIDAAERRPAVLIGAGVGVTPMLAMLRHIVYEGLRTRRVRPTVMIQAARTRGERGFDAEIAELVARADGKVRLVRTLDEVDDGAVAGVDYDAAGRVDMALLRQVLGFDDHDFYLCGPPPFMQSLYDGLRDLNIADHRIHAEAFGPASLRRRTDAGAEPAAQPSSVPVPVAFATSAKEARWTPGAGSLLDLAEARGLAPEFSCRGGSCGTCRTRIIEGKVAYATPPSASVGADEALICCAMPADAASGGGDRLILDL
jgi:ferredoxin-NADP reductase/predicted pyridoxine 5'-phosphate oxidase superfamily flavin-nucleotide-binding protein